MGTPMSRETEVRALLREALDELRLHIARIRDLVDKVELIVDGAALETDPPSERRARIRYGGGPSPLAPAAHSALAGSTPSRPERQPSLPTGTPSASTRELIIVSELAQAGYSREEIATRLWAQWGAQAAAVLRGAME